MSRVQQQTRRFTRAAAVWAVGSGVAVGIAGAMQIADPSALADRISSAAIHACAFGFVGDLWLAALLRFLSSQPSRGAARPLLLQVVYVVWNASVLATAGSLLARSPQRDHGLLPLPIFGLVAALLVLALVLGVVTRRLSPVPVTSWLHLLALVCLVGGVLVADLGFFADSPANEQAGQLLVLGGFLPAAGAATFFAAFDYESYEDRRWPQYATIAIAVLAVMRASFAYGDPNENSIGFLTSLASFGAVFCLVAVLHLRWRGTMSYWYERLAFMGCVVAAVALFLGLARPLGSPMGPLAAGIGGVALSPTFFGSIVLWSAALAVMLDQRDLPPRTARLVMWPLALGSGVWIALARLFSAFARRQVEPVGRGVLGACALLIALGLITLGSHLLRRPRLRAV